MDATPNGRESWRKKKLQSGHLQYNPDTAALNISAGIRDMFHNKSRRWQFVF